jgi:hypothetical protein
MGFDDLAQRMRKHHGRVLPRAHRQTASMPRMLVETGHSGYARTMRIAIACLVLMACKGAKPASSNNGSRTSGSPAASGSSSAAAPTCRAINEHAQTLVANLKPAEAKDVIAANPRRLDGFPSPEMTAAFERATDECATGECRKMNPAEAQMYMTNKVTDILAADCEKRAPSAAQRRCWINATTYAAFVACDSAP